LKLNFETKKSVGFEKHKIVDLFEFVRNGASIKQGKSESGIPITRIETIADGSINLNKVGYASIKDEKFEDYYLKPGDILMSHINSIPHLGKVAIFDKTNVKLIHGMNLLCLRPKNGILNSKYIFYFFKNPTFLISIRKITKKSVNQASFNVSSLLNFQIPLPPLPEQIAIANLLSKAEALIAKRKESLALLDVYLKSTFLELFGDPVRNEKGWERVTIRDLVTEVKYGTSKSAEGGKYKYLRMNNITSEGYWDFTNVKFIDIDEDEKEKYVLKKNDLIFNRTNSKELVGKTAVYDKNEEVVIAGYLIRVRTSANANPYYIWGYLNSKAGKLRLFNLCRNIVGMANINAQELQDIPILLPPWNSKTNLRRLWRR
jgi:type I restriction enzyme S subunit